MEKYKLSACTFIKNAKAGFCLYESMASWLPFVDEFVVLDLGSTDGTLEVLHEIAGRNPKIKVHQGGFTRNDASAFADVMNQAISLCKGSNVLAYQSDEIPHERLILRAVEYFERGEFDLSFWRYQLRENFQVMKWPPHPVHRVGRKDGSFVFVVDGMNTERTWDAKICSEWDGGNYIQWGDKYKDDYTKLPTYDMILDVGKSGAFRDTIAWRAELHFPFWTDSEPVVDGVPVPRWLEGAKGNDNWTKPETAFDIPQIMRFHLGKTEYFLRRSLFDALCNNTTRDFLGI